MVHTAVFEDKQKLLVEEDSIFGVPEELDAASELIQAKLTESHQWLTQELQFEVDILQEDLIFCKALTDLLRFLVEMYLLDKELQEWVEHAQPYLNPRTIVDIQRLILSETKRFQVDSIHEARQNLLKIVLNCLLQAT